ncbi:MAG: deoxyribodipyrimidine photo-lyase [Ardenticatenaceae bacterium]|nr:deoxyribodipyrimidine photo-lyase [Ardenticatenaceae bacterium]
MSTAIWWIRRDLRLADNVALSTALAQAKQVLPVWIFDPVLLASPYVGEKRLAFLLAGLRTLDQALQARGSRLIVRRGHPPAVLAQLLAETGAGVIIAEEDYSPYARRRDQAVAQALPLRLVNGMAIQPPGRVLKADGSPYTVFTPFSKAWHALPRPRAADLVPTPTHIPTPAGELASELIPTTPQQAAAVPFMAGEAEAQRRLRYFIDQHIAAYAANRDQMDIDGTSRLSPYLRFGMISPRQAAVAAYGAMTTTIPEARAGAASWLNELIWRDFYIHILAHFPAVRRGSFREKYDAIPWRNDETQFAAWCSGQTGYPVVDAAMRQLAATGWMHNRARMIVASFLTKDLLIDWRWGERWFMRHLVDGDPASNNGGWQWSAGTGTDAAPYFRIFNPVSQGAKFDPAGVYVRRWVPELARVPDQYIHAPWEMHPAVQQVTGCIIGRDYPPPIVDHRAVRSQTLAAYRAVA